MTNYDNTKTGELMPDEILDQLEHAFSMTGRLDGVMLKLTEEQYEYIKNLVRAKQSPPVQSDAVSTHKLDVHILLDTLADAARGKALDPETCQSVEDIAKQYSYKDFTAEDIQALYDCGPQSPSIQKIDGVREAVKYFQEVLDQGSSPEFTEAADFDLRRHIQALLRAAEQRVAGQAEAIEALKEARKTLSSIGGYMLIGASDEATVCNRDHVIPALALLTAQKGV